MNTRTITETITRMHLCALCVFALALLLGLGGILYPLLNGDNSKPYICFLYIVGISWGGIYGSVMAFEPCVLGRKPVVLDNTNPWISLEIRNAMCCTRIASHAFCFLGVCSLMGFMLGIIYTWYSLVWNVGIWQLILSATFMLMIPAFIGFFPTRVQPCFEPPREPPREPNEASPLLPV